ncbi:PRC-barrel domain-containing protein [Alteribacter natronophilus]|uniref:PRC-barrel domain-containing protein n=1 Tax=Alteribacter natronophilus TaxID=2583810 RepID=UPI00110E24F8|nr:PRC-barrel domain-containing protein [Alteribacter natronophilus]TMW73929.1 PRC-barrel domain containing protein [Alteribacter natronophilus]
MLFSYKRMLKPFDVIGEDDEIGSVSDLYFDEHSWTVRYIVVEGGWLKGETRFLSPASIKSFTIEEERLHVDVTKEQAKDSPAPEDEPMTRKFERQFSRFYGLNPYWMGAGLWGSGAVPRDLSQGETETVEDLQEEETNIISVKDLVGYEISTGDESFGKVKDILVEEDSFKVRYFVVDTNRWLPGGKEVLISTEWILDVNWPQSIVSVDLKKEAVEEAPEYTEGMTLDRDMETSVFNHYGKPKYWD